MENRKRRLYGTFVAISLLLIGVIGIPKQDTPLLLYTNLKSETPLDAPFSKNVRANNATTGIQCEPSAASDIFGNIVAGWDHRPKDPEDFHCAYSYSLDGGKTWSKEDIYRRSNANSADPVVAADDAGNVYRMALSFTLQGVDTWVEVSYSSDGGKTWSNWTTAIESTQVENYFTDLVAMEAHGNGYVYITTTVMKYKVDDIYFVISTNKGKNWSKPLKIFTCPRAGFKKEGGSEIAVDNQGNIYIALVDYKNRNMYFTKSIDEGKTFTTPKYVCDIGTPSLGALIPSIAVDKSGKNVYITWTGAVGKNDTDTWVVVSNDYGTNWKQPKKVNDDTVSGRQLLSWIEVDSYGIAHIAWQDTRSGNAEIYYSNSTDNGNSWSKNIRVSDTSWPLPSYQGEFAELIIDSNGNIHVFWTDYRNGNQDIYTASAPNPIPEFSSIIIPMSGLIGVVAMVTLLNRKRDREKK